MTDSVWLAFIAAFSGVVTAVIAPVVISMIAVRAHRIEKEDDWRRQDEVARRAAEASRAILQSNQDLHETTNENSAKLDRAAEATAVIHTLVNSSMTEAKKSELRALKAQVRLMEEMKDFRRTLTPPVEITAEGQAELDGILAQIHELEIQLQARVGAAEVAEKQIDVQKAEEADRAKHQ